MTCMHTVETKLLGGHIRGSRAFVVIGLSLESETSEQGQVMQPADVLGPCKGILVQPCDPVGPVDGAVDAVARR